MDEVERLAQARRQLVRLHQQRGERVVVDARGVGDLRQDQAQRLLRLRVVREKRKQVFRIDPPEDFRCEKKRPTESLPWVVTIFGRPCVRAL
ncbi:MAG: hypothetical protein KatS3mg104_1160 [Phycisphaerae bacterium]|jgi:hypothetical protein|nr:MAG: hypothetical protein KatS3mg104_1160 [Phycisphaerae bacterium]